MKRFSFAGALGWLGVIVALLAYALLSAGYMSGQSLWYQGMNLISCLGIGIETWYRRDYQPFWLNVIWGGIALIALISIIRLHT